VLTTADIIAGSGVFAGLDDKHLALVTGCAWLHHLEEGRPVFEMGQPADTFYLLRGGRVALQVTAPGRGAIVVQTLREGDTLGWSWLFPPYRWQLDAVALEPTPVVAFDGACLRTKCEEDHELGYQLMKRFSQLMLRALIATRVQLLDVYSHVRSR
jgi:CRP/FNR family cyclic AMP-dependent transcriptional regulator